MSNIVQVCHHPFPSLGGPAKTIRQFHDAVGARTVGFVSGNAISEEAVVPLAARVKTMGGKLAHYYYASGPDLYEAEKVIKKADLVLLHGLFTYAPIWAAGSCIRHGVPYAIALHGYLDPWALKKSRLVKSIWLHQYGEKILRHANAIVCATRREADKVAPSLQAPAKSRVISWACEIPDRAKILQKRKTLRAGLGFRETDRVLVFFGRLHSMKRPIETLRLVAGQEAKNLKLLVIGPDDDISRARMEAEALSLRWNGIRVIGPVFGQEKFEYLGIADAYISLSHRENFNYSLAEAMAAGLPPILSSGNDLGWDFVSEKFSWQLKTDEPDEARAAIRDFLHLPREELVRRGEAARKWVSDNLSLDRLRAQLNSLVPFKNLPVRRSDGVGRVIS